MNSMTQIMKQEWICKLVSSCDAWWRNIPHTCSAQWWSLVSSQWTYQLSRIPGIIYLDIIMATKFSEIFSGWQPCQIIYTHQHFGDWLSLSPEDGDRVSLWNVDRFKLFDVAVSPRRFHWIPGTILQSFMLIHRVPLYDIKFGLWYAVSASMIIVSVYFMRP